MGWAFQCHNTEHSHIKQAVTHVDSLSVFLLFIYTGCVNKQVSLTLCLLQHITSSCCLLGLFTSVLAMSLAGHGCQLQDYDRGPSALFIEMSHWAKMAYSWDRCMDGWIMDGEMEERNATPNRVSLNWRCVPMHTSEAWAKSPSMSEESRTSFFFHLFWWNYTYWCHSLKLLCMKNYSSAPYIVRSFDQVSRSAGVRGCTHCQRCAQDSVAHHIGPLHYCLEFIWLISEKNKYRC